MRIALNPLGLFSFPNSIPNPRLVVRKTLEKHKLTDILQISERCRDKQEKSEHLSHTTDMKGT